MRVASILAILGIGMASSFALGQELPSGTYNCITGFRTMLTIGKVRIHGTSFSFVPESGAATTGTYSLSPDGSITWHGHLGALRSDQIVESGREPGQSDSFWFKSKLTPSAPPETTSCRRL